MIAPQTVKVLDALSGDPPGVLYHYTDAEGLLGILQSRTLWASRIHYLNDAMESHHAFEIARAYIRKELSSASGPRSLYLDSIGRGLSEIRPIPIHVASLSSKGDLLSQWRAYCPSGGYSLGLSVAQIKPVALAQHFRLARCVYTPLEQQQIIADAVEAFTAGSITALGGRGVDSATVDRLCKPFLAHFAQVAPLLKHQSFSEESEWRLVSEPMDIPDPQIAYRQARGLFIPYFRLRLVDDAQSLDVPRLFVGPTPHPGLASYSVTELLRATGTASFYVSSSSTPYRSW